MNPFSIRILSKEQTPFRNEIGVYQDGTVPMCRDKKGRLWAMSGHSHMGHIGMFCGTCLDDMKEVYPIETAFRVGKKGEAFCGIPYPEGILPRGSIWPFGLYICPNTNRFFCFFHNETGWNGGGTGYVVNGYGDGEPDFRHIGLMHSDDEGRTWLFDRWVLTAEKVCFCESFNPDGVNVLGQKRGIVCLGAGDFTLFDNPKDDYLYLFYNLVDVDSETDRWLACNVYVARTRKRTDGVMGDFVKYCDGAFCEAGNLGRETPVVLGAWHPRVMYWQPQDCYVMSGTAVNESKTLLDDTLQMRVGRDLVHWSEPQAVFYEGKRFGNHYHALISDRKEDLPQVLGSNEFSFLTGHNGTDVDRYHARFEEEK